MCWAPEMYAPRKQAGFTLVELMIVVAIVGTVMAAAGPALGGALADRRTVQATHDVLRLGRQAYWESVRYRRAHVVSFTGMTQSFDSPGRVELLRGDTNSCRQDWDELRDIADCGERDSRCIAWADLTKGKYTGSLSSDTGPILWAESGNPTAALCYRPDGTVMTATNLTTSTFTINSASNDNGGGLLFDLRTWDGDEGHLTGVTRRVLFPLGGAPRRFR